MISLSMRGSSALRPGASPESPYVMRQIPNVLVGFDSSKGGHPAQTNSIFYNPEQLAIGGSLHLWRCEIRGARIHPPTGVSGLVAVEAMTHCAFGAEEFVSFFDARLQIRCAGGIPSRLLRLTRTCFARVARTVSRGLGSCSASSLI